MSLTVYTKSNPLVETFDFVPTRHVLEDVDPNLTLNEDAKPLKRLYIEGVFQRADVPNKNKRIYPKAVWEKHCAAGSNMQQRIAERSMIGHVEHPQSGTTDLSQSAILVTEVKLKENGEVWGRALVYNTPAGRLVQELIETGTKFGISSRGTGSVDSKGIVQEDYNCDTWDIVSNPSTPGAFPKLATEKTEEAIVPVNPDNKPVNEAAASVEQMLLQAGGPAWVGGKTGLTGNDLAMVFGRFISFVIQRGAQFSELEPVWTEFLKYYPQVAKAEAPKPTETSDPIKTGAEVPGANAKPAKESAEVPAAEPKADDEAAKKQKLDEQGVALLAEAKAEVTRLSGEVATLTEKNKTVSAELESSVAKVASLTEATDRLQSENDTLVSTLGALTAVNVAAQVREATEAAIRADSRLAAFRDVLEKEGSSASVAVRAKKLGDTMNEATSKKTNEPAKGKSLEERVAARRVVAERAGLPPSGATSSDDDAKNVSESVAPAAPVHAGARAAAAAIKKMHI